ncbi:MAG: Rieske 2Fe-2S domain-containing protein [Chloroflexi bacterium]|nr:Rieske 2Fe-2S domain-containing protein [Chloroflexota bacterium]
MMVILEMLSRAYSDEHEIEVVSGDISVDSGAVHKMAVEAYERGLGMYRSIEYKDLIVAEVDEIPDGERKIVQIDNRSIGIFHHNKKWVAISNHCLHVGGPIATGRLEGDTLICPWHGYRYDITDGHLRLDPSASLEMYPVEIKDSQVHIQVPIITWDEDAEQDLQEPTENGNEFNISELVPGQIKLLSVNGEGVAVFAIGEKAYAVQSRCTHEAGPLDEGRLEGETIICPWHGSSFNVVSGAVVRGPATKPLKTYRVDVGDGVGRVEQEDD